MIVGSTLDPSKNPTNRAPVELRKPTPLQSLPNPHQSLHSGLPAQTRLPLPGRQYPNLDIHGNSDLPLHRRPLRRHLPMPPHRLQLGHDHQGREMYQPRRFLRLHCRIESLHGPNGSLNPHPPHMETSDAPPTKNSRLRNPLSRCSVHYPTHSHNEPRLTTLTKTEQPPSASGAS